MTEKHSMLAMAAMCLARTIMPPERHAWADAMSTEFSMLNAGATDFALGCLWSAIGANFQTFGGRTRVVLLLILMPVLSLIAKLSNSIIETLKDGEGLKKLYFEQDGVPLLPGSPISRVADFFVDIFLLTVLIYATIRLISALKKPACGQFVSQQILRAILGIALIPMGFCISFVAAQYFVEPQRAHYPLATFLIFSFLTAPFSVLAIMTFFGAKAFFRAGLASTLFYAGCSVLWIKFTFENAWPNPTQLGWMHTIPLFSMLILSACGLGLVWLESRGKIGEKRESG